MTQPIHPMLERVARAMLADDLDRPGVKRDFDSVWEDEAPAWVASARAAIQALLESDEGMVEEAIAASITAMAYAGLPGDWSEALLRGDGRGFVPPGVLRKGLNAYGRAMLLPLVEGEGA